jgi:hypothetical protein
VSNGGKAPDDATYAAHVLPLVREASAVWVAEWRTALEQDGRAMEGGWPGTMAEARAFVLGRIAPILVRKGMPLPTPDRMTRAARDLYSAAREAWLSEAASES